MYTPRFDVRETRDAYVFEADLPGVREDDVTISITGNRLNVAGQREQENVQEGDNWYAAERSYGQFSRTFMLPDGVDFDNIHAEMKEGVLRVHAPKRPEVQPRRIQLGQGQGQIGTGGAYEKGGRYGGGYETGGRQGNVGNQGNQGNVGNQGTGTTPQGTPGTGNKGRVQ
jgi:HSP20 family molecular chaperone IbpA